MESNTRSHIHKEDNDYTTTGPNRHWNIEQTEIVMNCLRVETTTANTVTRALKDENVFKDDNFPTQS